ncbi:TIGR04086 family membrane protein [Paenibacillus abyssi]|uniref:TIGR04086 family membrane protein n=1 Tax=Paenibacillus abyssi TaxID=1340531 RepID=A0A917G3I1_9BACL|nr:TIGR04086 family membrane protein [Paenibacillus abyssi]GGG20037.1 hypothetical protein GCM10010916_41000 [Paenibacillus abyssi]
MNSPIKNVPKVRIASPLLAGIVYAFIWLCGCALVLSLALHFSGLKESELPQYTFFIHALCALAGGFVAGKRSGRKGWYHGGMLGLCYGITLLLVSFLAMDTAISVRSLMLLALTAAAAAIGGMIGINAKK